MSTTTDNRVVNMNFNGEGFDSGVARSEKAFGAFKDGIEQNGSAISQALAAIESKLSVGGVAIANVVTKMTNSVMAEMTKFSNVFLKGPMLDGYDEYTTKLRAMFNMFSAVKNKGSSLADVKNTLKELNDYSDRTIYNFKDMTNNISKFTTKGSSLIESSGIVIGMSNLAASAGVTNERLAGATFQMSQLGDTLNLLDYMSLSTATMDTEEFKNAMIDAATEADRMTSKFNGKGESNSAAEYFKKATKYGLGFKEMISDKVFKKADFVEVMRQFSIDTKIGQTTLDNLRTSFKKTSATSPINKKVLDQISAVTGDKAFSDEMVRIGNVGNATIKTLGGVATKSMDVETYLKKAADKGLTFEQMCKDTTFTVGDLQKALDRLSIAKTMWRAATEVRDFGQMVGIIRESIGSGWAAAFEEIFGGLEQATALWTGLTNAITGMIAPLQDNITGMLHFWNVNGGREAVITGLCNAFNALADIVRPIGQAFKAVFAPLTGATLTEASKKFESFTEKLRPSRGVIEGIGTAFYVLFAVLKFGKDILVTAFKVIAAILDPLKAFGPMISEIGGMFRDLFIRFGNATTSGEPAITFMDTLLNLLTNLSKAIFDFVGKGLSTFRNGLSTLTGWLKPAVDTAGQTVDQLQGISDAAKNSGKSIKDAVSEYVNNKGITGDKATAMIDDITQAVKGLNKESSKGGGSSFGTWLSGWTELLPKSFDDIMALFDNIIKMRLVTLASDVGKGVANAISALIDPIREIKPGSTILALSAMAVSLLILSISISRLSRLDYAALAKGLSTLAVGLFITDKFIKNFAKTAKGFSAKELIGMRGIMRGISLAVLSLAISLRILSGADPTGLIMGMIAMLVVLQSMAKAMDRLSKIGNPAAGVMALRTISVAVLEMSIGLRILANANIIKLQGAVVGISVVIRTFANILQSMVGVNKAKLLVLNTMTMSIVAIALSMRVLASAKIGNVLAVTILMDVVLRNLAKMITRLKGFKKSDDAVKAFALMVAALAVLIGSLALLAMCDFNSIVGAGLVISKVIKSLVKTFKELPSHPGKKVENFRVLMNAVSLLAGALSVLAKSGFTKTIGAAISLKIVMKMLSKVFGDLPRNRNMTGVRDLCFGVSMMA